MNFLLLNEVIFKFFSLKKVLFSLIKNVFFK